MTGWPEEMSGDNGRPEEGRNTKRRGPLRAGWPIEVRPDTGQVVDGAPGT